MSLDAAQFTVGMLMVLFGYWLGAVPFGVFVGRISGVEVREEGSGNIGATNVARTVGKQAGVVVLVLDALKGALPILALLYVVAPQPEPWWLVPIGMAPIVGHCFSIWLKLSGGKGVATALGVFLALDPPSALIGIGTFALVYALVRVASLGSILGSLAIAGAIGWRFGYGPHLVLSLTAAALIIVRHRGNLARLLRRSELRV